MAIIALAGGTAFAEDLPAVSGVNGKLDIQGGNLDGYSTNLYGGSLTAPLGPWFGAQADVQGGNVSGAQAKAFGGHLFWRDPEKGMAGLVASRTGFDTVWGTRYGVEGEVYLNDFTIGASAGKQIGEFLHTNWFNTDLRYYPLADVMLKVGASHYAKENAAHLGIEWRPGLLDALPGLTLFGDAAKGDNNYEHALAGVRVYFGGGDKSLERRHREDDPLPLLFNGINQGVGPTGVSGTGGSTSGPSGPGGGSGGGGGGSGGGGGGGGA